MSFSNPKTSNPASRFFEWKGGDGKIQYYDKDKGVIKVKIPFEFIALDSLFTITGFHKKEQMGIWSNEVRNLQTQPFTVKTSNGTVASGLYKDIKDSLESIGAKFSQSVYIGYYDNKILKLGNIKFAGASLSPWIDFTKEHNVERIKCVIDSKVQGKVGNIEFWKPTFDALTLTDKEIENATNLDLVIQAYLKDYFSKQTDIMDEIEGEKVIQVDDEEGFYNEDGSINVEKIPFN